MRRILLAFGLAVISLIGGVGFVIAAALGIVFGLGRDGNHWCLLLDLPIVVICLAVLTASFLKNEQ